MIGKQKTIYALLVTIGLICTALFAIWWFNTNHIAHHFTGRLHAVDILCFIGVSYVIWHPIGMELLLWAIGSHIQPHATPKPQQGLKVAFVTTFVPSSESADLLTRTLPAMVAARYPHDTWLLDEGNDPYAQHLCKVYGVKYFTRRDKPHYNTTEGSKFAARTKGGNHNAWYDQIGQSYDIVAQIDTDFTPRPDFLTKTLGHFNDPQVAFVGTPQIYGNGAESIIARGAAEQSYSFYGPILRGLHSMDMTMLIGANHIIRVAALQAVDLYAGHLTEDLLTGMKLHAGRWKSVYVPEALAIGQGPANWTDYFNQQLRWAFGCMHILLRHSPRLLPKMKLRHRLYYFVIQQHYFSGAAMGIGALLLSAYFFFGVPAANTSLWPLFYLYVPLLIWQTVISLWLQRFNIRPKEERGALWAGKPVSIAAWPIYLLAWVGIVRGRRLAFKVTPKGKETVEARRYQIFGIHIAIGLLACSWLATGVVTHRLAAIMVFWAAMTCLTMLGLVFGPGLFRTYQAITSIRFKFKSSKSIVTPKV